MTSANPLFVKWLTEWYEFHRAANTAAWLKYKAALVALQRHSTPVTTGRDCRLLPNFDPRICEQIDKRIRVESRHAVLQNSTATATTIIPTTSTTIPTAIIPTTSTPPPEKVVSINTTTSSTTTTTKQQKSSECQGSDAILTALIQKEQFCNYRGYMTETELKQEAQRHCKISFTDRAWNSMPKLIEEKFVERRNKDPCEYHLSVKGRLYAKKFLESTTVVPPPVLPASYYPGDVRFTPGKFEIVLIVNSMLLSSKDKMRADVTSQLDELKVLYEIHDLHLVDFVFIVRERSKIDDSGGLLPNYSPNVNALVLPYIFKSLPKKDLSSIIATWTHDDRKERLKATKLQVVCVIESNQIDEQHDRDEGKRNGELIVQLEEKDGFWIKETTSFQETVEYVAGQTTEFEQDYKEATMVGHWMAEEDDFKNFVTIGQVHLMFFSDFIDYSRKYNPNSG